jgi:myosin heavy subunit
MIRCVHFVDRDDLKDFHELLYCLKALHFTESDFDEIFSLLAAILHLGNVSFYSSTNDPDYLILDETSQNSLTKSSDLLGLPEEDLTRLLKFKTIKDASSQEEIILPRNSHSFIFARDSLCKTIYERLFNYIVQRINIILTEKLQKNPSHTISEKNAFEKQKYILYTNGYNFLLVIRRKKFDGQRPDRKHWIIGYFWI